MNMSFVIIVVIVVLLILYVISIFNTLVALKNRYLNAFAQIEVQLKRRYDLIPNLVETAKAYLKHEKETLEFVVKARNQAAQTLENAKSNQADPQYIEALGKAEQNLQGALGRLNVVVEAYPELKANENMIKLHEEIAATENRVAFARQAFNDFVMSYNTYRQSFPQNILAASFGHTKDAALLEFQDSADMQNAPKISF
ncbi:MAG: LemA family protein [Campylobacteraceae bacterium]|jgi:LemA protein|nr:LemA family protein [Campylobacteraceae bacterium]